MRHLPPARPGLLLSTAIAAASVAVVLGSRSAPGPGLPGGGMGPGGEDPDVVTLWARDDFRFAFSFRRGAYVQRIDRGELQLEDADLVFQLYGEDVLSFGFARDAVANFIDLGDLRVEAVKDPRDRAPRPDISVYHTLHLEGNDLRYQVPQGRLVRLSDGERVLTTTPAGGLRHFKPEVGHVYLMLFRPEGHRTSDEVVVKMQVLDKEPGRSVTFRWHRLR